MINVMAGRKGGAGKSTLTCNIAPILASLGQRTAVVDHDPQGTLRKWWGYRQDFPELPSVDLIDPFADPEWLEAALANYDQIVIDTQGSDSDMNRALLARIAEYDVPIQLIIPVKPSQPDIDTLPYFREKVVSVLQSVRPDVRVTAVLNEAPTTTKNEIDDARSWLYNFGLDLIPSSMHSRKAYRDSMASGKSVMEMTGKAADKKASDEIQSVFKNLFRNTNVIQEAYNHA